LNSALVPTYVGFPAPSIFSSTSLSVSFYSLEPFEPGRARASSDAERFQYYFTSRQSFTRENQAMVGNPIVQDLTSALGGITAAVAALTALCTAGASFIVAGRKFWQQLKVQERQIEDANRRIDEQQIRLNKLVETSMSDSCFHHLAGIYLLHEYKYLQDKQLGELFQREFYFLKNRGFIGPETLEFDERLHGTNIAEKAWPTPTGLLYIELRKTDIPVDWLSVEKRGNLRIEAARKLGLQITG
jgi:hypothetical protein